jgi:hypothetical protein
VTSAAQPRGASHLTDSAAGSRAAFYCVANEPYFLGTVAMVNSLRLLRHTEPIFVLDCGLSAAQRELLSDAAAVLPAPDASPPVLLKTYAPLRHPAEVTVLIDADIIVTRSLRGLIVRASQGLVMAVDDGQDRFFPEWGKLTGGVARRRPYVSSCMTLLGGPVGRTVLETMNDVQGRVEIERTPYSGSLPDFVSHADTHDQNPYYFADQDVLNAVLATKVDPGQVEVLERRAVAIIPFDGLRVVAEDALRCAYDDGTEPYALHHLLLAKPWLGRTGDTVYSRLLRRLLSGDDLAVRVPAAWIPRWLRRGALGSASRQVINVHQRLRWRVHYPLRERIRSLRRTTRERSG